MSKKLGQILGGGKPPKSKVVLPPVEKPTPMPDEEAIKRAQMRAELKRRRGGRMDTILTDEDNLGG